MKRIFAALTALTLVFALASCAENGGSEAAGRQRTATVFAMDTFVTVTAYCGDETLEKVGRLVTELDGRLSRTKADSDIGRLNASGTDGAAVSGETAALLREALAYCAESGGVFDITVAPLTDLWDVAGKAAGGSPTLPSSDEIADAMLRVGYEYLTVEGGEARFACEGMSCDLGGIAKGYAADKAVELLKADGVSSALLQVGSSIYVLGEKPDGSAYTVGVRDPEGAASEYIGTLPLKDKYITSSGDYERYFELDGTRYCHIFDAFTGRPVDNDLRSVTVVTDSGTRGDYLSTTLFCLGLENAVRRCREEDISALFITKDRRVYTVGADFEAFTLTSGDYTYEN